MSFKKRNLFLKLYFWPILLPKYNFYMYLLKVVGSRTNNAEIKCILLQTQINVLHNVGNR